MLVGKAAYGDGPSGSCDFLCFPQWYGAAILGGVIGSSVGGVVLTGTFVKFASADNFRSSGSGSAMVGSLLGAGGGLVIVATTQESVDWSFWPGFATVILGSSLGAVVFDRNAAVPSDLGIAPWSPRPGLNGAQLSLKF